MSVPFKSLKSSRRTYMLEAIERQSYKILCHHLASSDIDYLKSFPELDKFMVEAADGHFIDHACHTKKESWKSLRRWVYLRHEPQKWTT